MHFVGCPRPHGSLESAPRAGLLPHELVAGTSASDELPTWESYWDEEGRYLVRAVTTSGDAWFSLVDEPETTGVRAARPTPRATRVLTLPGQSARRLMCVGARRRGASAGGAPASLMLVGRRPGAGSRRAYAR